MPVFIIKPLATLYFFALASNRGKVILTGGIFTSIADCEAAIELVKEISQDLKHFASETLSGGKSTFSLLSQEGDKLAVSRIYGNEKARCIGIKMVHQYAKRAKVKLDSAGEVALY